MKWLNDFMERLFPKSEATKIAERIAELPKDCAHYKEISMLYARLYNISRGVLIEGSVDSRVIWQMRYSLKMHKHYKRLYFKYGC